MAANFENFKISLDFPINFRKSHQISKNYLKSSESYGQKPLGGSLKTPGLNKPGLRTWLRSGEKILGKLKGKDDFKIVAIVGKRKFDSEPYESFVE